VLAAVPAAGGKHAGLDIKVEFKAGKPIKSNAYKAIPGKTVAE